MPAKSSDLSSPKYGYDFVVATTQASINGAMLSFLASRTEPEVNVCYVAGDDNTTPVRIAYDDLKKRANGADPFNIDKDDTDVATNPDLQKLFKAKFMVGFRVRLGVPPVDDPTTIPDVVVLGANTATVTFHMLASEFNVVQLDPGNGFGGKASWMRATQPRNNPWIFTSDVDLRLSTVSQTAFKSLPQIVQDQIKNMGGSAFSVQQLLFDLTNARLASSPTMSGVKPGTILHEVLSRYFVDAYFTQMNKAGQPLLGCAIVHRDAPVSTMTLTNLDMQVSPYVDSNDLPIPNPDLATENLATLNYLCTADGAPLPPPVPFSWNWVDKSAVKHHDGVLSINRNTFAHYFRQQLENYVPSVCLLPRVSAWVEGGEGNFLFPFDAGQKPTVTLPISGQTVLKYHYDSRGYADAGYKGVLGSLEIKPSFDLTVEFVDNKIIISQHLIIYVNVRIFFSSRDGNVFDKKITETYNIGINGDGQLEAPSSPPVIVDKSGDLKVGWFEEIWTQFNDLTSDIENYSRSFAGQQFQNIPLDTVTQYVFPGGHTFIFKNVSFSDNQDLTAFISYAEPKYQHTVPAVGHKVLKDSKPAKRALAEHRH